MKKIAFYVTALTLLTLGACGQSQEYKEKLKSLYKNTVALIRPEQLYDQLQDSSSIILLDTRELNEFNVSHIKGSIHVGYKQFNMKSLDSFPFEAKVVVYCSVGYRSERIGEQLLEAGYKYVQNLYGGVFQWVNMGYSLYDIDNQQTLKVHAYSPKWGAWLEKGVLVYE